MIKKFHEVLGWYGVMAIFGAYFLLTINVFSSENLVYQSLNLTGSIGILLDAYFQKNYQPVVLNIFWAIIAIWGIIQILV